VEVRGHFRKNDGGGQEQAGYASQADGRNGLLRLRHNRVDLLQPCPRDGDAVHGVQVHPQDDAVLRRGMDLLLAVHGAGAYGGLHAAYVRSHICAGEGATGEGAYVPASCRTSGASSRHQPSGTRVPVVPLPKTSSMYDDQWQSGIAFRMCAMGVFISSTNAHGRRRR